MNRARLNFWIDAVLGVSFFACAVTGIAIFLFMPSGVPQGRLQVFLGVSKGTWSFVHDWSGILMTVLGGAHVALHWNWILCMTKKMLKKEEKSCETDA